MLFLLNDVVFQLDPAALAPSAAAQRFRRLSLGFIRRLGAELYAETPLLHYSEPDRARRLAALIGVKFPNINAALFVAPAFDCSPDQVQTQFAEISFEVMAWLYQRQKDGALTNLVADRQVWRRLAA
ncbi:MAG: hypothetical protein ACHP7N_01270 [Caulobacterales bacterium]